MSTHTMFTVLVADHEADNPSWRVRHAAETIKLVGAYFISGADGAPVQADDGTFEVHAPSRSTLATLREMLTDHEGFVIVSEGEVPGNGIIVAR